MTTLSLLESEFIDQRRPYSQNELKYLRNNLYKTVNLGTNRIYHEKCKHFYNVKINSRKEKEIQEKNDHENVGNCSVCWKISKTPKYLKPKALDLINAYCNQFYEEPKFYNYNLLDLENVFYKWLYLEVFKKDEKY